MSETVKLIIEIPSIDYEYLKNNCIIPIKYDNHIYEAILNGTPLDTVKAEIEKKYREAEFMDEFSGGCNYAINEVLEILDSIGKGEK